MISIVSAIPRSPLKATLGAGLILIGAAALWLYLHSGWRGFNVILGRGMTTWTDVARDDARLPLAMRMALRTAPPEPSAGAMQWRRLQSGVEVGELPVLADGVEVDRILLARLSPREFRFEVLTAPSGHIDIDGWMARLSAAAVINGSYYAVDGAPDTPVVSNGRALGPSTYDARHGAFVTDGESAGLRDLQGQSWQSVLAGAKNAMVNYPLLIGADGQSRAQRSDSRWLANRSFIGEDRDGRIILGTTREAFFSLDRFAEFLRQAPLDLKLALNLDGGPPACQAVKSAEFDRSFCGKWETQTTGDRIRLLGHLIGERRWGLPIVLAVFPKHRR